MKLNKTEKMVLEAAKKQIDRGGIPWYSVECLDGNRRRFNACCSLMKKGLVEGHFAKTNPLFDASIVRITKVL